MLEFDITLVLNVHAFERNLARQGERYGLGFGHRFIESLNPRLMALEMVS